VKKQRFSPEQIAAEAGKHGIRCNTVAIGWTVAELAMLPNLKGYVHVTRAALPLFLKRGGGTIVYTKKHRRTSLADEPCLIPARRGADHPALPAEGWPPNPSCRQPGFNTSYRQSSGVSDAAHAPNGCCAFNRAT